MDMDEIIKTLTEADQRSKSNTHRLDGLEKQTETLNRMAVSMERMATKQDVMCEKVDTLSIDVETLKAEPGKRWKFVVEKAIYFVVAAVVGFALAKFGF